MRASSSECSSTRVAKRRRSRARSVGATPRHCGKAALARATAASVSSTPAGSSSAIVSSVAGLVTVSAIGAFDHGADSSRHGVRHRDVAFGDKVPKGGPCPGRAGAEETQKLPGREEVRRVLEIHCRPVAAPAPLLGLLADSGANRVQHDVPGGFQEVRVLRYRPPRVVVPKEMTRPPVPAVHLAGMPGVEEAHSSGEARFSRPDEKVVVVCHQAIRDDAPLLLRDDARKPAQEVEAIEVVVEDRLAVVPARGEVVVGAGLEDPQCTSHSGEDSALRTGAGRLWRTSHTFVTTSDTGTWISWPRLFVWVAAQSARAERYCSASRTSSSKRRASSPASGCHSTPTAKRRVGSSTASIVPSFA